ncbi:pyridoxamine 5'-phosphate oxidase family protein [Aspergillus stella-maris]|uniref:pyridoxamine 5'-phosphate oxidase family protein n=1 Tax=Aspergillus stella-maris TaxID=1810926 RepID=UPI003CCD4D03
MEPALLRRHGQRGSYDIESAKAVFDDCYMAHVAYVDNGLPQCLPMIALITTEKGHETNGTLEDNKQIETVVYLHGHPSMRLAELTRQANREGSDAPKVCITATKIDGLVLSSAPNGHTFNYRSAVIHGTCTPVTDKTIKRSVMHAVTNHIVADRWEQVNPVASFQVGLVSVIRVSIDSLSMKSRAGPPGIQPRNPEVDGPDVDPPPWVGVVPLWEQLGEPVDSGLSPGAVVPERLTKYIEERNKMQQEHSKHVAG